MSEPEHNPRPKIKALAGMRPHERNAYVPPSELPRGEQRLPGAVERPCARCGRVFLPSMARRLLCKPCFRGRDDGGMAA